MKILLTGFEPFGGSVLNPSEQVVRALDKPRSARLSGARFVTAVLPVDWQKGPQALEEALRTHRPDAVLCLGEGPSRAALSIERVAVNLLDFRIPDNSGVTLTDQPVIPGGPAAYFVTLPARAIHQAILAADVPAELSMTAGTYLCNQILYHLLHSLAGNARAIPAGFIHLPRLPEQVVAAGQSSPSMSLDTMVTGIRAALEVIVESLDIAKPGIVKSMNVP